MDNKLTRVAFACGLGGLIGAVSALEIASRLEAGHYLAVVGLLVGGAVGWLAYDLKEVAQAFSQAWKELSGWRPDWERWRYFFRCVPYIFPVAVTGGIVLSGVIIVTNGDAIATWDLRTNPQSPRARFLI